MAEPLPDTRRAVMGAAVTDILPMLLGVAPFGLVAGAAPVDGGLDIIHAVGLSTLVFAGASQLAAADVLVDGGTVAVAVITAWTINLRMILYSASIAPLLAHERFSRRMVAAYLMVDQTYAFGVSRFGADPNPRFRLTYFVTQGLLLWTNWQLFTVIGAVAGSSVPEDIPLDFALPLVFLVLLVPAVATRPAVGAALGGGLGSVAAAELGAGRLSLLLGAVIGITIGTVLETLQGDPLDGSAAT